MDLFVSIEHGRFVGREFLLWLWFESEVLEGALAARGEGAFELWLEAAITLAAETEQSRLTGATPSSQPEAAEALRQGKLPTRAGLRLVKDGLEYGFTLAADTLALGSVRIPATLGQDDEAVFEERMDLVEKLDRLLGALYADFLVLRLGPAWAGDVLPAMRAWIRRDGSLDLDAYERAKKAALARRKRGPTPPRPNLAALARTATPQAKGLAPAREERPRPKARADRAAPPVSPARRGRAGRAARAAATGGASERSGARGRTR